MIREHGDPSVLECADVELPRMDAGDVMIDVAAAGVNRADISQRLGRYPPPAGAPAWPGLEVSGIVADVGSGVTRLAIGDRVCALLAGGGYAERVVVDARHVLPVPPSVDLPDAAGLIEVAATVWSNVFMHASLKPGERLLVHGGSSGVGTMAIQLGRAFGARVAATAGSAAKLAACEELGAELLVHYQEDDFVEAIRSWGEIDVILDPVGGGYLERNLTVLAPGGRIANIANLSAALGTLDFRALARKRATIFATTLRASSADEKAAILASVAEHVWPLIADGTVRPVIGARFPLSRASDAHRLMESSTHIGKILLVP